MFKTFPWENNIKPVFINEKGYEWYNDDDTNKYLNKQLPHQILAGFFLKKDEYITRVIINNRQEIVFESQQLEAILTHIDIRKMIIDEI